MKYIAIFIIKIYHNCKYQPTCSNYAIGCLREFGFIKGMYLSIKRVARCNPASNGGYDPIPLNGGKNEKN